MIGCGRLHYFLLFFSPSCILCLKTFHFHPDGVEAIPTPLRCRAWSRDLPGPLRCGWMDRVPVPSLDSKDYCRFLFPLLVLPSSPMRRCSCYSFRLAPRRNTFIAQHFQPSHWPMGLRIKAHCCKPTDTYNASMSFCQQKGQWQNIPLPWVSTLGPLRQGGWDGCQRVETCPR